MILMSKTHVLIVDDDDTIRNGCQLLLKNEGYSVVATSDPREGLRLVKEKNFPIVFVDYKMPKMTGIEFLRQIRQQNPNTDVVMITGFASIEMAIDAIRLGAYDYIPKPFMPDKILAVVAKLKEKHALLSGQGQGTLSLEFDGKPIVIIGKSPVMQELFRMIGKVAPTDSTVLIYGESGTGKELVAKAIHANSGRSQKAFYTMDCGSLVESLFESELFGHVKGSFTGATATKHGAFELANGGTFFFDEIGNISLNIQAKILRAIQEREIKRIGDTKPIAVDVRVIAATNLDLRRAVEEGIFREDLYYRLSVIPIRLPALRERKGDIPLLTEYFIEKHSRRKGMHTVKSISAEALGAMQNYSWPGNVREMENVIERAVIIEESEEISLSSLPGYLRKTKEKDEKNDDLKQLPLAEIEKEHIGKVLGATKRNISQTAKILGIDRKTLYDKIKKYDL
jgi:DNA-binding NtrC family response regulator